PKKYGRRVDSFLVRSMEMAALPPEWTVTSVPATAGAMTLARICLTQVEVCGACGDHWGVTEMMAAVGWALLLRTSGPTLATPGAALRALASRCMTATSPGCGRLAATVRGPL